MEITKSHAYYNPVALVLKDKGWVEDEFGKDGTKVEWVLSLGSNKALEFLNGSVVDFGSSAGSAALLARSNDIPIKSVYVYSGQFCWFGRGTACTETAQATKPATIGGNTRIQPPSRPAEAMCTAMIATI
jgi:hypothetical protein